MNTRRFYLFLSSFTLVLLFVSGVFMLNYLKAFSMSGKYPTGGMLSDVLTDIRPVIGPINVLILGGDRTKANTDTMLLANFNPRDNKVSMLSIPRDTRVVWNDTAHKINYAYVYSQKTVGSPQLGMEIVGNLLNVDINYYVYLDTAAFRKIVDLLGGVDYYIPADMHYDDPVQDLHIHLEKGLQHLDGAKAEQYVRFRQANHGSWSKELLKIYSKGDISRIEAQQNFIKELIKQKMNIIYLPKVNKAISTVFESIETNFKLSEILTLATYAGKVDPDKINWFTLKGTDRYENGIYYFIPNKDYIVEIISQHFRSDKTALSSLDSGNTQIYGSY